MKKTKSCNLDTARGLMFGQSLMVYNVLSLSHFYLIHSYNGPRNFLLKFFGWDTDREDE